jgi:hypothetical protein
MTTTVLEPPRAREPRRRGSWIPERSDVPSWIRLLAAIAVALTIVACLLLVTSARSVNSGIDVIGKRTAPHVTATEDLYFALADMDGQLANVLLAGNDPLLDDNKQNARSAYDNDRVQADADLQQAASLAGDGGAGQKAIRDLLDQFGRYQGLAADTMLLEDRDGNPAGRPSPEVLDVYRRASGVMRGTLESLHQLTVANGTSLNRAYDDTRGSTATGQVWVVVLGAATLAVLVGLQVQLRITTRRRINPGLLAATVVFVGLLVAGFGALSSASGHLRTAKQDAFDSLLALRQARAVGYDSNADESRYLVDPQNAAQFQQSFLDKSNTLADVHVNRVEDYDGAFARALQAYQRNHDDIEIGGFFGTELKNITFPGERAAAEQTLAAYQTYQRADRTVREKARVDLSDAIAFDTGNQPGESNYVFGEFDEALTGLIGINQQAFDRSIADAEHAVSLWTLLIPLAGAILVTALVVVGIRPRLAEYR